MARVAGAALDAAASALPTGAAALAQEAIATVRQPREFPRLLDAGVAQSSPTIARAIWWLRGKSNFLKAASASRRAAAASSACGRAISRLMP